MGVEGDVQVDRRYPGGTNKAVYSYAADHNGHWQAELGREIEPGAFGENLTTEGLIEDRICIGDQFRFGSAVLEAVQPRQPCFKLGLRVGSARFVSRFREEGKPGIYWKVIEEGMVAPGDAVELVSVSKLPITIHDLWRMVTRNQPDAGIASLLLSHASLDAEWREPLEAMVVE
jgi:MOSC domain-containing protein YiiM